MRRIARGTAVKANNVCSARTSWYIVDEQPLHCSIFNRLADSILTALRASDDAELYKSFPHHPLGAVHSTHKVSTAVYQVTRPGHEHCDVTEGVLLDITPLEVDGKKLVTLYDKDLTEGVNLLIGESLPPRALFSSTSAASAASHY